MRKYLTMLLLIGLGFVQKNSISDGPYIFIEKYELIEKRIFNSMVITRTLDKGSQDALYYHDLSTFNKIRKIAAFSDIHGQYDLLVNLSINNKIIDKDLNWLFGEGHLVIVGDIFDRGNKVNEILWLIYDLKEQAKEKVAEFIIYKGIMNI